MNRANRCTFVAAILMLLMLAHSSEPPLVYACSYRESLPTVTPKEEVEVYEAVFTGRVISISDYDLQGDFRTKRAVVFEVMEGWKGATKTQMIIYTGLGYGDCGVSFRMNETWLVYAGELKDGKLHTGIYDLTSPLLSDRAKEVLLSLGEGKAPVEKVTLASPNELANYIFVNWFAPTAILITVFGVGTYLVRNSDPYYRLGLRYVSGSQTGDARKEP